MTDSLHVGEFFVKAYDMSGCMTRSALDLLEQWIVLDYAEINGCGLTIDFTHDKGPSTLSELKEDTNHGFLIVERPKHSSKVLREFYRPLFCAIIQYNHWEADEDFDLNGKMEVYKWTARGITGTGAHLGFSDSTIKQACSFLYSEIYLRAAASEWLGEECKENKTVLVHPPSFAV